MALSLLDTISNIVKERFAETGAVIDGISVEPDFDSDGDPILRITVVFDSDMSKLESRRLAGLARHVRPKLAERNEAAFPIFSFISKRDNERLKRAAA